MYQPTIQDAYQWSQEIDKFVFCLDLLEISGQFAGSDEKVDELEEKFVVLLQK